MGDTESRSYTYKKLAEILVKHENIHEGLWALVVEFGLGAANVPSAGPADTPFEFRPTALVSVGKIGIQQFDQAGPLTIDAAVVNPPPQRSNPKKTQKRVSEASP